MTSRTAYNPRPSVSRPTYRQSSRKTNRPNNRQVQRTNSGVLGHGKDFDHDVGAALIIGGGLALAGILGAAAASQNNQDNGK